MLLACGPISSLTCAHLFHLQVAKLLNAKDMKNIKFVELNDLDRRYVFCHRSQPCFLLEVPAHPHTNDHRRCLHAGTRLTSGRPRESRTWSRPTPWRRCVHSTGARGCPRSASRRAASPFFTSSPPSPAIKGPQRRGAAETPAHLPRRAGARQRCQAQSTVGRQRRVSARGQAAVRLWLTFTPGGARQGRAPPLHDVEDRLEAPRQQEGENKRA